MEKCGLSRHNTVSHRHSGSSVDPPLHTFKIEKILMYCIGEVRETGEGGGGEGETEAAEGEGEERERGRE